MQDRWISWRWQVAQFLEHRWWRRYLRKQSPAAYLAAKDAYWQRLLAQLEWTIVPGHTALDAGCGPAGIFLHLRDRQQVTALDPLLHRYASLAIFSRDRYPEVRFVQSPLENLGSDGLYDDIYCINAINHVRDWAGSMDVLTSVARPGTRMLLISDVHRHRWLQPVFRLLPGDALHPQQHRAEDYRRALTGRGWRIDREVLLRRETIFDYRAWVCEYRP
ncbi:class I SAM-dependent methyltransferase [Lewinella sp. JB7]|uniref:class I SAM-dependent methyltransferase n=1 Tax=Lewinella sp. JB7 TaxID=2962887 RepID=UPI0020C97051|nr:class I SAM-dependent methyltransferase [Lewinella sp. JB7]MCP9235361.1 class I SAM-dependent methyltransferase [Lewinella sp. JB7]